MTRLFTIHCRARDLLEALKRAPVVYEPAPGDELLELLTHVKVETALRERSRVLTCVEIPEPKGLN